jgi:V-type H+-transporting ATPase subunit E
MFPLSSFSSLSSPLYSSGGAVLLAFDGRITCDNTLDQRLALAFEQRLPDVRKLLFGASVTRKFID